jgi:transcriptional regulator with XRE-family HTH domain
MNADDVKRMHERRFKLAKSTTRAGMPYAEMPIAQYLSKQIDIQRSLGKSQRDIAVEIGYDKPTMVSMFKRGEAKVPLDKIPALARALRVDAAFLFRLALLQYWHGEEKVIAEIFRDVLTRQEQALVHMFRAVTKGADLEPDKAIERKIREWARDKTWP